MLHTWAQNISLGLWKGAAVAFLQEHAQDKVGTSQFAFFLLFWELAEVKQLTKTPRSEVELFWCQIMGNAKIFSSSQHAAPGEVTGFSCYYLALASDEPVLICCNFTVFLWSGRGEGGLRMMLLYCQDCIPFSILLNTFLCLFSASPSSKGSRILLILVGIEKPEGRSWEQRESLPSG